MSRLERFCLKKYSGFTKFTALINFFTILGLSWGIYYVLNNLRDSVVDFLNSFFSGGLAYSGRRDFSDLLRQIGEHFTFDYLTPVLSVFLFVVCLNLIFALFFFFRSKNPCHYTGLFALSYIYLGIILLDYFIVIPLFCGINSDVFSSLKLFHGIAFALGILNMLLLFSAGLFKRRVFKLWLKSLAYSNDYTVSMK